MVKHLWQPCVSGFMNKSIMAFILYAKTNTLYFELRYTQLNKNIDQEPLDTNRLHVLVGTCWVMSGCISLWVTRLPKLSGAFEYHWLGNLGNLAVIKKHGLNQNVYKSRHQQTQKKTTHHYNEWGKNHWETILQIHWPTMIFCYDDRLLNYFLPGIIQLQMFLYYCPDWSNCRTHLNTIGWATWAI